MTDPLNSLLYLGRQPILGREQQLLAYALVLQDGLIASDGASDGNDHTLADAAKISKTTLMVKAKRNCNDWFKLLCRRTIPNP